MSLSGLLLPPELRWDIVSKRFFRYINSHLEATLPAAQGVAPLANMG